MTWHRGLEAIGLVLVLDLLEIDLRLVHGLDAGLLDRLLVPVGKGVFQRMGVDGFLAEMGDQHRARHFAGPETRHLHVLRQLFDVPC